MCGIKSDKNKGAVLDVTVQSGRDRYAKNCMGGMYTEYRKGSDLRCGGVLRYYIFYSPVWLSEKVQSCSEAVE